MSGSDSRDWYALPCDGKDYRLGLNNGIKGLKIAYSQSLGMDAEDDGPWNGLNCRVNPEVADIVDKAASLFSKLGCIVEMVDSLSLKKALSIHGRQWLVYSAKAMASLKTKQKSLLDDSFVEYAEMGRRISLKAFTDALSGREELGYRMNLFHEKYDLLLTPTFQVTAPQAEYLPEELKGPAAFTCPFNQTKQPAASIPCGLTQDGLPVGLQIVGPLYRDDLVLRASQAYEEARGRFPLPPLAGS
jgi:aspartyl-tRNA(Asn)/glutamyl-tRNA(Gln) amidotransferase subunit A